MKIKRSLQHGHVMFDLDNNDVALLADGRDGIIGDREGEGLLASDDARRAFEADIDARATTQTDLKEEILSHRPPARRWGINE
jgi:hypothetical protein